MTALSGQAVGIGIKLAKNPPHGYEDRFSEAGWAVIADAVLDAWTPDEKEGGPSPRPRLVVGTWTGAEAWHDYACGLERHLKALHSMILEDMGAATNRDLAADGPVGDEEGAVWARIEALAREQRSVLEPR